MTLDPFSEPKNNTMRLNFINFEEVLNSIRKFLIPMVEKWSNEKLSSEFHVYGIRRYLRGANLALHVDRLPSHILSAILQVKKI